MLEGKVVTHSLFTVGELQNKHVIGEGASAIVHGGTWKGMSVAVKVFRGGDSKRAADEANRERNVLSRIRHPNIISMLGTAKVSEGGHANVLQFCSGGVLDVEALGGFRGNPMRVMNIAVDIARALDFAHSRGIMHRDVKVSQILTNCCNDAILNDWGLACELNSSEVHIPKCGTDEFMAPEVYNGDGPYGAPADTFSFGILLWCLAAGKSYPYADEHITAKQAVTLVASGKLRPRKLQRLEDEPSLMLLMQECWQQDPLRRPKMDDVLDILLSIREDVQEHVGTDAAFCFM